MKINNNPISAQHAAFGMTPQDEIAETQNKGGYTPVADHIFARFGINHIAYIRADMDNEKQSYIIYAADGTELATAESYETARHMAMQNSLVPVMLH